MLASFHVLEGRHDKGARADDPHPILTAVAFARSSERPSGQDTPSIQTRIDGCPIGSFERVVKPQIPFPLNETDFSAAPPPGVTRRIADLAPVDVGLKTTLTVQLAPTATRAGQLCV